MTQSEEWDTGLIRKIKNSLSIKIFFVTVFVLCVSSAVTYGCIAFFLPVTYTNELDQALQEASEELIETLKSYDTVEQAETILSYFEMTYQTQLVLLDKEGNTVYPYAASETEQETVIWTEEAVKRADTAMEAEENGEEEDVYAVGITTQMYENGTAETMKQYDAVIGEQQYTLVVIGGMKAVSQAADILKRILPYIVGIVCSMAVFIAFGTSAYLARPIIELSRISKKMASLDFDEKCQAVRGDEVGILGRSLNELSENLSETLQNLQKANEKLKSDMEKEKELEKKRIAFFSAVSHELKTPVTILKGHLGGMISKIGAYQNQEYYLKRSLEVTDNMEAMIQELLTISRMESGKIRRKKKTDLAEQIRIQLADTTELMEEKNLQLLAEIPDHLYRETDEKMMEKVFRNVIINAICYSPEKETIRISLKQQKNEIFFRIENTGVFLPEEALPHLFEAFYRVDGSRNRATGGSGLGLYIVKMVLEQHDADYKMENSKKGVYFSFSMKTT